MEPIVSAGVPAGFSSHGPEWALIGFLIVGAFWLVRFILTRIDASLKDLTCSIRSLTSALRRNGHVDGSYESGDPPRYTPAPR